MPWLSRRGRGPRRGRRAERRLRPAAVVPLEARRLLSQIRWVNEFDPANGFDQVFQQDSGKARALVNAAIDEWERTISSFNYQVPPTFDGAFELTFQAVVDLTASDGDQPLGITLSNSIKRDASGKPYAGTIQLDDDASDESWYFDQV